jgi:hypothetical protein
MSRWYHEALSYYCMSRSRTLRLLGYQASTLDISQVLVLKLVGGLSIIISFFY